MKPLAVCLILVCVSFAYGAVSLDDIVKLSRTGTNDDVILQMIQKEGLGKPVTSKDVVYLKQQGVSDRVIQYLMKLSSGNDESLFADKSMRSYYKTAKDGKRIRVVTNLDENGKRMGGPIPPDPAPQMQEPSYRQTPPPQEIRVVVENGSGYEQERYEEEYVNPKYEMPPFPSYDSYSTPYYPYYPYYPIYPGFHHGKKGHHFPNDSGKPNWNFDYSKNRPLIQPRQQRSGPSNTGSTAGAARRLKAN